MREQTPDPRPVTQIQDKQLEREIEATYREQQAKPLPQVMPELTENQQQLVLGLQIATVAMQQHPEATTALLGHFFQLGKTSGQFKLVKVLAMLVQAGRLESPEQALKLLAKYVKK